jgi:hypothetical protein
MPEDSGEWRPMLTKLPEIRKSVVSIDERERTVLVDLVGGRYYALNATASRMWFLLAESAGWPGIVATLSAEYEMSETEAAGALEVFVNDLAGLGLVSVTTDDES